MPTAISKLLPQPNQLSESNTSKTWPAKQQQLSVAIRARYGEVSQFLISFNPSVQYTVARHTERALMGTAPLLAHISIAYSEDVLLSWLLAQIENLNDYCGTTLKLHAEQMKPLAQMIAIDYYYLKITEVMLFFYRLKGGRYGTFYGSIDPLKLMQALALFASERLTEIRAYERIATSKLLDQQRLAWNTKGITYEQYLELKKEEEG